MRVPLLIGAPPPQSVHVVPHMVGSVSAAQLVLLHAWKLGLQLTPHISGMPLQVGEPFTPGSVHDMGGQFVPQVAALVSVEQVPLQLCVPVWQVPLHAIAFAMHAPAHSLNPPLQVYEHEPLLHTAVPFGSVVGHAMQLAPQRVTSVSGAQVVPLHLWKLLLQV